MDKNKKVGTRAVTRVLIGGGGSQGVGGTKIHVYLSYRGAI